MKGLDKKSTLLAMGLGLVCCTLVRPVLAIPVPILNYGFEDPVNTPGGFGGTIADWQDGDQQADAAGTFNPTTTSFPDRIPQDGNVAFSNGPFISQVLSEPLTAGATYNLQVDVGNRIDTAFSGYDVQLRAGGVTLVGTSMLPVPDDGKFTTAMVNFTAPAGHNQLDTPLEIRLLSDGIQANFDDVRLETTLLSTGTSLNIFNASFEESAHSDGGFSVGIGSPPAQDWVTTDTGLQGDFNPTVTEGHPTVGDLVAFSNGGMISQALADVLLPSSRYVLTVDLIKRSGFGFPDYQVQLLAGGQLLAEDVNSLSPSSGFLTSKVEFTTGAADPELDQPLEIRMITGDGFRVQALYDNVRLTRFGLSTTTPDPPNSGSAPEPATAALGLIGLGALITVATRRAATTA